MKRLKNNSRLDRKLIGFNSRIYTVDGSLDVSNTQRRPVVLSRGYTSPTNLSNTLYRTRETGKSNLLFVCPREHQFLIHLRILTIKNKDISLVIFKEMVRVDIRGGVPEDNRRYVSESFPVYSHGTSTSSRAVSTNPLNIFSTLNKMPSKITSLPAHAASKFSKAIEQSLVLRQTDGVEKTKKTVLVETQIHQLIQFRRIIVPIRTAY